MWPPYRACAEVLTPAAATVTMFGDGGFTEVRKVRMKSFRGPPIQYDWTHRHTEGRPCEDKDKMAANVPKREAC